MGILLENIKRIGIFMIAAQTVIHFAAGKQYERYMKMIAGVIVLLQFLTPFLASSGDITARWQTEMDRISQEMEERIGVWQEDVFYMDTSAETIALHKIEEEVRDRLSNLINEQGYRVADVQVELEETNRELVFARVIVTVEEGIAKKTPLENGTGTPIRIDEITIGNGGKEETDDRTKEQEKSTSREAMSRKLRSLFAQALEIDEDRVEVMYRGDR